MSRPRKNSSKGSSKISYVKGKYGLQMPRMLKPSELPALRGAEIEVRVGDTLQVVDDLRKQSAPETSAAAEYGSGYPYNEHDKLAAELERVKQQLTEAKAAVEQIAARSRKAQHQRDALINASEQMITQLRMRGAKPNDPCIVEAQAAIRQAQEEHKHNSDCWPFCGLRVQSGTEAAQ